MRRIGAGGDGRRRGDGGRFRMGECAGERESLSFACTGDRRGDGTLGFEDSIGEISVDRVNGLKTWLLDSGCGNLGRVRLEACLEATSVCAAPSNGRWVGGRRTSAVDGNSSSSSLSSESGSSIALSPELLFVVEELACCVRPLSRMKGL